MTFGTEFGVNPSTGVAQLTVTGGVHYSGGDSNLLPIDWDWGDGTAHTETETDPVHVYTSPGTYTVVCTTAHGPFTQDVLVTAPSGGPSIRAWYNGQQVYLGVQLNALVFDGQAFVRPQDAEYVAIVETVTVGPESVPAMWPVTQTLDQVALTWTNVWLCKVIALDQPPISDIDIVAVTDPNNGQCVCGISCLGTDLQYVQVTVAA